MAKRGESTELAATIDAVCRLEASDKVSLLKLAETCAACMRSLQNFRGERLSDQDRRSLQKRCGDQGIAALAAAIELGLGPEHVFNDDAHQFQHLDVRTRKLQPLRDLPDFRELVENPEWTGLER